MKNKYHVGLDVFGIFAGILKNKEEWEDRSEVTKEAVDAVAFFLLFTGKECHFEWQGKKYVMRVEEYQEDTDVNVKP